MRNEGSELRIRCTSSLQTLSSPEINVLSVRSHKFCLILISIFDGNCPVPVCGIGIKEREKFRLKQRVQYFINSVHWMLGFDCKPVNRDEIVHYS